MKTFKLRASQAGKLMTNARSKTETISETAKTYIQEWIKEQIYGVKKEISNKYITKGNEMEDQAIDAAISWLNLDWNMKNEEYFNDDFFQGTPDLIYPDFIVDIKNSWDCWTFPLFEEEIPTKDYFYQLQVYMHLTGRKKAKLVYVLLDTPSTFNTPEITYCDVDIKYRIKVYEIDYDFAVVEELQKRVINAREYINNLKL
jgi:hypothetical protein